MPWRFSEDIVSSLSSTADHVDEEGDIPTVLGVGDKYSMENAESAVSKETVPVKPSEGSKRETAAPTHQLPDHNQNLVLLKCLSDTSGNLLSADRIMREIFRTDFQQMGMSSRQDMEPDEQQGELFQREEIVRNKPSNIRPAKRKSFPKPIQIKMKESSRPPKTKHKTSSPFPYLLRSPPGPSPAIPTSSHTKCFSCPRRCSVSAEGELACCEVCKKAQTQLFQAASKMGRGKLGREEREEFPEVKQLEKKTSDVELASDDGQPTSEHFEDSKPNERFSSDLMLDDVSGSDKILPVGGLLPSSTPYPSQCGVSTVPLTDISPHRVTNSGPPFVQILDQGSSSSHKSEDTLGKRKNLNQEVSSDCKLVKVQSAAGQIPQILNCMESCPKQEENIPDKGVKKNNDGKDVDAQSQEQSTNKINGLVPDLPSIDKCLNLAAQEDVGEHTSHSGTEPDGLLLIQSQTPPRRTRGRRSLPVGRVCKVKCRFVNNSVFKLLDIEKIKQLDILSVPKAAQNFTAGKSTFPNIPDPTLGNPGLAASNQGLGTSDNINKLDNVIFALTSVTSKPRIKPSISPSPVPAPALLARPRRSSSSKRECPSCGKLSLLPGQAVCCDSCVAAQEHLLRQRRRKTLG